MVFLKYLLLLFFFQLPIFFSLKITTIIDYLGNVNVGWDSIKIELAEGEMRGFLTYNETILFLEQLSLAFPNNVILEEIGLTAENRSIYSVVLTKDKNLENFDTLPIMLFTGLHHAREPLSFTMNLYLILKIMYDSIRGDPNIMEILNGSKFVFVPALNIDGYAEILEIYNRTMVLTEIIRKNRRKTDDCPNFDIGVDLNRNYDYGFNAETDGTFIYPCSEDYRGSLAFSEPETQAIKSLVERYGSQIKIALNFHAFGNIWIIPFSSSSDPENSDLTLMKIPSKFYDEFTEHAPLPVGAMVGNTMDLIDYVAIGEASDWMLGKYGIISFSPELGDQHEHSERYYPSKIAIIPILDNCYPPIEYLINSMKFYPNLDFSAVYSDEILNKFIENNINLITLNNEQKNSTFLFVMQILNKGMVDQLFDKLVLKAIDANKVNQIQTLKISQVFYKMFDEEYYQTTDSFESQQITGMYSDFDIYDFSSLSTMTLATNDQSCNLTTTTSLNFSSRSYLKIYFLIDTSIFTNPVNLSLSLQFDQGSIPTTQNTVNVEILFSKFANESSTSEEEEEEFEKKINETSFNTTELSSEHHFKFLTWSLISIGVFFLLVCALGVIFMIWRRRRREEETRHLLKGKTVPTGSQLPEEENIAVEETPQNQKPNQPVFIIGNEHVDLESKENEEEDE